MLSSRPRLRKLLSWFGRAALALLALAALAACAGATYQRVVDWRDAHRFSQRGKSFQAGRVWLNLDCSGQGTPTVILDSGMGSPALDWIRVQPEVAKFTRVCSYDRAGYGWSEPSPDTTSLHIARELKALLEAAGEKGPYVMVGHSFGGYNVRVFSQQYPRDVAGVVLVDASHPDEGKRIAALLPPDVRKREKRAEDRQQMLSRISAPFLRHLGIQRMMLETGWAEGWDASRYLSKDLKEEFLYLEQQSKYTEAVEAEDKLFADSGEQARAAGSLGDRPLIVLTAGRPYEPDPMLTNEQMGKQRDLWINVLQVEEAHPSTRGKQIVALDSGHDIPDERPDAVISAIHDVWLLCTRVREAS